MGGGLIVFALWKIVFEVVLLNITAILLQFLIIIASRCSSLAASSGGIAHVLVDPAPAIDCMVLALVSAIKLSLPGIFFKMFIVYS